ncbi:hypothetical protein TNCV_3983411 [Trichonephila clavipes]|nr:hypothetical protein TNCV_3983411 [Trichonephila clavipes]
MALYRSPLTATLWPSSFLKKYGPMIPPAHKAHQTVSFSGYLENALVMQDVEYPRCLDNPEQRVFDDMLRCRPLKQIYHRQHHGKRRT